MDIKDEGRPLPGATIEAEISKTNVLKVAADENGRFPEITVPAMIQTSKPTSESMKGE